jgi:uncharacterized membrane protein
MKVWFLKKKLINLSDSNDHCTMASNGIWIQQLEVTRPNYYHRTNISNVGLNMEIYFAVFKDKTIGCT